MAFMLLTLSVHAAPSPHPPQGPWYWPSVFAWRWPSVALFLVVLFSNAAGGVFNLGYNYFLVIRHLPEEPQATFRHVAAYHNLLAYSYGVAAILWVTLPLVPCRSDLRAGREVSAQQLARCRRRLINTPLHTLWLSAVGWLPGAVVFPLALCWHGRCPDPGRIWGQFLVSFGVSTLLTMTQTFVCVELFLIRFVYPEFFQGARPAEIPGAYPVGLRWRLWMYWLAVAVAPLAAMLVLAVNFAAAGPQEPPRGRAGLAGGVAAGLVLSTGVICAMIGLSVRRWGTALEAATAEIARGNYHVRISEVRTGEWGKLTDRFNDMVAELDKGQYVRETFGQFVGPAVRDEILERYPGVGGKIEEITVLFADIRGFTARSAGQDPDQTVKLLNRFLSLAVQAVEDRGGWVNKFLGDGIMALFNAPLGRSDHAGAGVGAARALLLRLRELNGVLVREGHKPLEVGIGIHSGPALVGCVGAELGDAAGKKHVRRELTAIGETVNLGQRLEQLTKTCGGPVLLSESTRARLREEVSLTDLGYQSVPGFESTPIRVYRLDSDGE
jgi:adenylate cyclase